MITNDNCSLYIKTNKDIKYSDNFKKILTFFVFHYPNTKVSSSGITLDRYQWEKPWKDDRLRLYLYSIASLKLNTNIFKVTKRIDIDNICKLPLFKRKNDKYLSSNKILFYTTGKTPDIMTIFYYIRCALAHGRFIIKKNKDGTVFYDLEVLGRKEVLNAHIVLKEETLIKRIEIIEIGPNNLEYEYNEHLDQIKKEIVKEVEKYNTIDKNLLCDNLQFENTLIRRCVNELKKNKKVIFRKNNVCSNKN